MALLVMEKLIKLLNLYKTYPTYLYMFGVFRAQIVLALSLVLFFELVVNCMFLDSTCGSVPFRRIPFRQKYIV